MRLRVGEILALNNAVDGLLKGGNVQILRRNNQDDAVTVPFKLSADIYQWASAILSRINPIVEEYNVAQAALIKQHSAGKGRIDPGTPEMMEFTQADRILKDAEKNFRAVMLPLELLKLDDNPAISGLLTGLKPVLKMPSLKIGEEEPELESAAA